MEYSSSATRTRATALATEVGRYVRFIMLLLCINITGTASYHMCVAIDAITKAIISVFEAATGSLPKFLVHGGGMAEDIALQNVQV